MAADRASTANDRAGESAEPRTRGGWAPVGTGAQRRAHHSEHGTPRGRRAKQNLLDAARRVFERVGYFGAKVEEIISEAGVARGTFYTYFPDKLAIFQVLTAEVDKAIQDAVSAAESPPGLDPVGRLDAANRRYIEVYRRNAALYGLGEQVATMDPVIHERRLRGRLENVERVRVTICRWQSRGLADPSVDAANAAALLVAMTSNFCYWWFVGGETHDDEEAARELTNAWVRVTGLRSRPAPRWLHQASSSAIRPS